MQVPAEVSATAGEAAVLPCTFTHPHRHYDGPLTAIWRAGEPFAGPQVFRCAAARGSELCQTALSLHGRFRLLGNPRRNDLSLRIERLALADDGRYFCRVEFAGDVHDRYESRQGVRLRVTGERAARLRSPRAAGLSVRGLGWDPRGYNGHTLPLEQGAPTPGRATSPQVTGSKAAESWPRDGLGGAWDGCCNEAHRERVCPNSPETSGEKNEEQGLQRAVCTEGGTGSPPRAQHFARP